MYVLYLRTLIIDTAHFDECLYLLDNRLDSFTININSIQRSIIVIYLSAIKIVHIWTKSFVSDVTSQN